MNSRHKVSVLFLIALFSSVGLAETKGKRLYEFRCEIQTGKFEFNSRGVRVITESEELEPYIEKVLVDPAGDSESPILNYDFGEFSLEASLIPDTASISLEQLILRRGESSAEATNLNRSGHLSLFLGPERVMAEISCEIKKLN